MSLPGTATESAAAAMYLTMLAQNELIFRLLLKMTVGKGPSDNYYFWRASRPNFNLDEGAWLPRGQQVHTWVAWQPWSNGQDCRPPSDRPGFDSRRLHFLFVCPADAAILR